MQLQNHINTIISENNSKKLTIYPIPIKKEALNNIVQKSDKIHTKFQVIFSSKLFQAITKGLKEN